MRTRSRNPFTTVKTAGLLLPIDLLSRIAEGDRDLAGLTPESYHLNPGERLNEAVTRAWNICQSAWKIFRQAAATLPASDAGTTLTRDRWLLTLFNALGYGRLQPQKAIEINEKTYPISHGWSGHLPIHLVSFRYELERRTPGASGAATRSPYSVMQELLNRSSAHRWGFLSNGLRLFVLRDNASLSRAANVEFDLETLFDSEAYADFLLLFLVCHQSRVEIPPDGKPENCWLEKWSKLADDQGTRAREKLRDGVQQAIEALGAGFLTTPGNHGLRDRLRSGELVTQDYYRQLLRVVYRLLLLLVAEEKRTENGQNLLHPPSTSAETRRRYSRFYSVGRLRTLATQRRGTTHHDLYASLKVLFEKLRGGYDPLGIPALGSFLFSETSTADLDAAYLSNQSLLDAIRALCITEDTSGRSGIVRRPVDFANLGSDELGSVYESLLELHPRIDTDGGPFTLGTSAGNERKTTGSYYTPTSLINCLLDSALDPVVQAALNKPDAKQAEQALLNLKVCDPACGSGHFLIAASDRLARHLATLRTGDDEPSALLIQHAKRDIIGHCIYGVDINPMSVELCKVALWMEAMEPGKPLSFLDHHIQCGNSLLGTIPALLAKGIPDEAFTPIEGDIKARVASLKKQNKSERPTQDGKRQRLLGDVPIKLGNIAAEFLRLNAAPDSTLAEVDALQTQYARLVKSSEYQSTRLLADTWCATFVWIKDDSDDGKMCPTERDFRKVESHASAGLLPHVRSEVERLSDQYQFFHWHLAFPEVFRLPSKDETPENELTGWSRGFDVVLGNPPWERIKLQEKEWFAERNPEITDASNAAARKRLIDQLRVDDPMLHAEFLEAVRHAEGESHLLRNSNRFPLCGRGDINVYAVFAESMRDLLSLNGRSGCVLPTGVATDDTTKFFFQNVVQTKSLVSLFDFENRAGLFPAVDSRMKFCLFTNGSSLRVAAETAIFVFFAQSVEDLSQVERSFSLNAEDIGWLNPNTRTCPIFRSNRDSELTKSIYRRVQVLITDGPPIQNNWGIKYTEMFHSAHDSATFLPSNTPQHEADPLLPYYEAKQMFHFDHRWAIYRDGKLVEPNKADPLEIASGQHLVRRSVVMKKLAGRWDRQWRFAWRDITASTNERTLVAGIIPEVVSTDKLPVGALLDVKNVCELISCLTSFVVDYVARQKMGGTMKFHVFKQLPVLPPETYAQSCQWAGEKPLDVSPSSLSAWIQPRVLELTYTAWDLAPFAKDCGYNGPPFRWDEERRFLLRAELDAAFFHLYLRCDAHSEWLPATNETPDDFAKLKESFPKPRDAVAYILDTFPIVRRKDEQKHNGEYRTKTTILSIYDEMSKAIATGIPYKTHLDPLPGPPETPLPDWPAGTEMPAEWPTHIHSPHPNK